MTIKYLGYTLLFLQLQKLGYIFSVNFGFSIESGVIPVISDDRAASWENQQSAYVKTKAQISFLNPKFQASSSFLYLYRSVCVGPVRKPHSWFSY